MTSSPALRRTAGRSRVGRIGPAETGQATMRAVPRSGTTTVKAAAPTPHPGTLLIHRAAAAKPTCKRAVARACFTALRAVRLLNDELWEVPAGNAVISGVALAVLASAGSAATSS